LNERIEVEAGLDDQGRLLPRAFTWRGRNYATVGYGRKWSEGAGRHVLVMAPGDKTFEIANNSQDSSWRMVRSPRDFGPRIREV